MAKKEKKSLGESLAEDGVITAEQLKQAQEQEKLTGQRLRSVLVKMGFITEADLVLFLSGKLGLPRIELSNHLIDPKVIELVPEELARKYGLIPVLKIGDRLTCAMVDPWNVFALDEIRARTNFIVEPAVATEAEIKNAQDEYYGAKGTMEEVIEILDKERPGIKEEAADIKELEEIVKEPTVIRLVNLIIIKAISERASDIHIEPEEDAFKTRLRVDGILHELTSLPKHLQSAIISRIKIMANLNIAERRAPQDGRFSIKIEGRQIDIRVSCVSTVFGENVVLRLLDVGSVYLGLDKLGFSKETLGKYQKLISRPYGIILVTGPTGCGKTTTLYASLDKINTVGKNIVTIEDPVEYKLAGIRQTQIDPKINLTFATGLRSILRQDPDVIMVGEIRDFETAEIAVQAALTGHLVFSTLHTNDAATAITRLIDMGVEPFLVSSSLICILAQRLLRIICCECKEKYIPPPEVLKDMDLGPEEKNDFYRGRGCPKCMHTGYKGRIAIFELLIPDEKISGLTVAKAPSEEIKKQAKASGMITLKEDAGEKAKQGLTTLEEVLRLTQEE